MIDDKLFLTPEEILNKEFKIEVLSLNEYIKKEEANSMYRYLN